jgi:hypothetical protein
MHPFLLIAYKTLYNQAPEKAVFNDNPYRMLIVNLQSSRTKKHVKDFGAAEGGTMPRHLEPSNSPSHPNSFLKWRRLPKYKALFKEAFKNRAV